MAPDQPTAAEALKELGVLVGEWTLKATPPGGEPWPGEGRASFEWLEGDRLLLQRFSAPDPAPNGVCVIGCDAANDRYFQLYTDERDVCRVYEMSIGDGEWKLWRDGEPFSQRFTAKISEDGDTLDGRWEAAKDGANWEVDFDLTYTRAR